MEMVKKDRPVGKDKTETKLPGSGGLVCRVLTPQRTVFARRVESVSLDTAAGRLEIFARYEPTIAPLSVGAVLVREEDGSETSLAVHGGYVNMSGNTLVILADSAEVGGEIDIERARQSLVRARSLLAQVTEEGAGKDRIDADRARFAILRSLARLKVAGQEAPPGRQS